MHFAFFQCISCNPWFFARVQRHSTIVRALLAWYRRAARDLPWRRTRDPYAIWVSEIMLQQTQVKTVLPFWERWMRALPDVASLARAKPARLHKLWEGLGYYTRVRNLQKAAQIVVRSHGGRFPEDFDHVLALPGIGRYTAGAICSIAFNQPKPILDGNVIRVLARVFGIGGNPREKDTNARLWELAGNLVEAGNKQRKSSCSETNQALMELGALVCSPRQPQCGICPVAAACEAYRQRRVEEIPAAGPRAPAIPRHFAAFIVEVNGRLLARQRPDGAVNAHLWEFPNVELGSAAGQEEPGLRPAAEALLGIGIDALEPLCAINHTITRYRIRLEVFRVKAKAPAQAALPGGCWLSRRQLGRLAMTGAHKKVLHNLG
jgi:A/G-specific adenine glycosylase